MAVRSPARLIKVPPEQEYRNGRGFARANNFLPQIADAMRLPPDRARTALASVKLGSLPYPSPMKVNEQREVIRAARQRVLDALAR